MTLVGLKEETPGARLSRLANRDLVFLLLTIGILHFASEQPAKAQCYEFASGADATIRVNLTNLPKATVKTDGAGDNTYEYQLRGLQGNTIEGKLHDETRVIRESPGAGEFTISVSSGPVIGTFFVLNFQAAGSEVFSAQIALRGVANPTLPHGLFPNGLPSVFPPISAFSETAMSYLVLVMFTQGKPFVPFQGKVDAIRNCGSAAPVPPASTCSVTLSNRVGDTIRLAAQADLADPNKSNSPPSYQFSSSGGELDAWIAPNPGPQPECCGMYNVSRALPTFIATKANETISGARITGTDHAVCKVRSVPAPAGPAPNAPLSVTENVQRVIDNVQMFPRSSGAEELLNHSEARKEALAALRDALKAFDPSRTEDRQVFSHLAELLRTFAVAAFGNIRFVVGLSLERFAEVRLPVNDPAADVFCRKWAQSIAAGSNYFTVGPSDIAAFLVDEADTLRANQDYRLAAFLYRKALAWGDVQRMNFVVSDRTPTKIKLADCLMKLGETAEAERYLPPTTAPPKVGFGCVDPRAVDGYRASVSSAEVQLAKDNVPAASSALQNILPAIAECTNRGNDSRLQTLYVHSLAVLGRASWAARDGQGALKAFSDFAANYEHELDVSLMDLSESMARVPYVRMMHDTELALDSLASMGDVRAYRIALDILASRSGRLQEMQSERARLYRASGANGERIFRLRSERATLALRGRSEPYRKLVEHTSFPANLSPPAGMDPVTVAIAETGGVEDNLTWNAVQDFHRSVFATRPIAIKDVAGVIDADTVVLCYAVVPRTNGRSDVPVRSNYVVWTLGPKSGLSVKQLGDAAQIDDKIRAYLKAVHALVDANGRLLSKRPNSTELDALSHSLFSEIIPEWQEGLTGAKRLIVIPDGLLQLVPFGALLAPDGRNLIASVDVGYASGLRDFLRNREAAATKSQATFFAYPYANPADRDTSFFYLTPQLEPRPTMVKEVEQLARTVGGASKLYIGEEATEAAAKSVISPSILHIAAHGLFVQKVDPLLAFELTGQQPNGLNADGIHVPNPFLHSFLALAEYPRVQPLQKDDGILTALEIADMNLEGTDLAVASGCSTGSGPIEQGDGVYGMRAAFSVAGARTQVVTLWDVSDAATQSFMKRFYDLMLQGVPKITALSHAQRDFLEDEQYSDPLYWAPFTASGDNGVLAIARK
jgi:CHAT domain-containing protein